MPLYEIDKCSNALFKAQVLAERIKQRSDSRSLFAFYRSLKDYGSLNKLTSLDGGLISDPDKYKIRSLGEGSAHFLDSRHHDSQVQELRRWIGIGAMLQPHSGILKKLVYLYERNVKDAAKYGTRAEQAAKENK